MITTDLFPMLKSLSRADKLKVMQFLIAELAKEEEPTLQAGATYSLWSPLNSHEAAHKLSQLLESDKPIAELRPVSSSSKQLRPFGLCAGEFTVPDDFDAPLPEDIISAFEGK
jgi:antitoxin (DNA-binding transcriptional repressor) of toxin-antitoxin stability system